MMSAALAIHDILYEILTYIPDGKDLRNVRLTCGQWNRVSYTTYNSSRNFSHLCRTGDLERIKVSLNNRHIRKSVKNNGLTTACRYEQEGAINLLLDHRDIDPSTGRNAVIRYASHNGREELLVALIESGDPRIALDAGSQCAIRWSARNNMVKAVKLLLQDRRVDPSAKYNQALHWAIEHNASDAAKLLLMDPRMMRYDLDVQTGFLSAVIHDNMEIVKWLLDTKGMALCLPIHTTWVRRCASRMAKYILRDRGYIKYIMTQTSRSTRHDFMNDVINVKLDIARIILKSEDFDLDIHGGHLLKEACRHNCIILAKILMDEYNINPDVDDNGPIKMAAGGGFVKMAKILMDEYNVDPSVGNNGPVKMAMDGGHIKMVEILLGDARVKRSISGKSLIEHVENTRYYLQMVNVIVNMGYLL